MTASASKLRARDVYFFKPNLIGYARVLLAVAAFSVAFADYRLFYACYFASAWLDALSSMRPTFAMCGVAAACRERPPSRPREQRGGGRARSAEGFHPPAVGEKSGMRGRRRQSA